MKTGKIKFITPKGKGKPFFDQLKKEEIQLDKHLVGFADGTEYTFSAVGDFKFSVGTEIQYEVSNEQYKFAKGAKGLEQPIQVVSNIRSITPQTTPKGSFTTNDSILLQVCYKENMAAYAKDKRDVVIQNTVEDYKSLKQFLNQL